MNDGDAPAVSQERRRAERVQDAVGLQITRLLDQSGAGELRQSIDREPVSFERPTHKISLSAVGVAFAHDVLMRPGELISIDITLFPSCQTVQADGRIVSANDTHEIADGDKPTYRVMFESISDVDRDVIAAQVKTLVERRPVID